MRERRTVGLWRAFPRWCWIVVAAILMAQIAAMWLMGREPICKCGYVALWHGQVISPENSQHLSDWYAFTHITHGLLLYALLAFLAGGWSLGARLAAAVFLEAGWEVIENTPYVIERYREATMALDYYGDSIVNSIADSLFAMVGFLFAASQSVWRSVALGVGLEFWTLWAIRDNLALNVLMLLAPMEMILKWQAGG